MEKKAWRKKELIEGLDIIIKQARQEKWDRLTTADIIRMHYFVTEWKDNKDKIARIGVVND